LGTGYSDLSSDDYRPSPEWYDSPEARALLAERYVGTLEGLASEFDTGDFRGLREHKLREQAGQVIINAYSRGFLRGVPNLGKFVAWHTASDEDDPVVGVDVQARRCRCPTNLFLDVIGGHLETVRLESDGKLTHVGPKLDDGILPAIDQIGFKRGNAAEGCRFLAATIAREATIGSASLDQPAATTLSTFVARPTSDLLRDQRTIDLLSLLWRVTDREEGVAIVDLHLSLQDDGLFTEWTAAGLIEVVRRNHCHVGGGVHAKLVLEQGWSVADFSRPDRKRVWQLLEEVRIENVEAEIRHRVRLGRAGDIEAARLARLGWREERTSTGSAITEDLSALNIKQRLAYEVIRDHGPIPGKPLATKVKVSGDTLRRHILPALKPHGLRNDRDGRGYYLKK
jgi:hypothetical protein